MEILNAKNLAITMLQSVGSPGLATILSNNLVQSSNDPSLPGYTVRYWPVQITIPFSGANNKPLGLFIAEQLTLSSPDTYLPMVSLLLDPLTTSIFVGNVNFRCNESGPEQPLYLGLRSEVVGTAIVKRTTSLNGYSPSLGPIVTDWIDGMTEFSILEMTGQVITINQIP